jgi:prepilin-type N-terminal cleavage/methylation domain
MRRQQGFTLIELMIVVAIVGILAVVAIPAYQDYATRAKVSEAISMASQVKASVSEAYISDGQLPATNADAGLPEKTSFSSTYVSSIEVLTGKIKVELQNTGISGFDDGSGSLEFNPDTTNQNLTWNCKVSSATLNPYVPSDCRV